ncbi:prophage tail fiber N-terminal domain-containing protein [Salmonella enterica]|nr:prophage tail fiber N-terminal domain-containing protein [Salmonella enterica]
MATILGTLRDELGNLIVGCRMSFIEQATARHFQVTTSGGANPGGYSLSLSPGIFRVLLKPEGTFERDLGNITIYTDSPDGSLDDFLTRRDVDTRPEALRQFEALAKQATDSATQASDSEAAARDSAGQAATSEQKATRAATTATTAAGTATGAAQQAATSEQHASQSEKNAAASEASVSQIVLDITTTGETVKQAIQTQGQHFVDMAHAEATNASRSARDAQTASQAAQQAKTEARTQADNAAASATRAQELAGKSADAATRATTAATEAANSATQAQEQAAHLTESVTQAQVSATQAAASADDAHKSALDAEASAQKALAATSIKTDGSTLLGNGTTDPLRLNMDYHAVGSIEQVMMTSGDCNGEELITGNGNWPLGQFIKNTSSGFNLRLACYDSNTKTVSYDNASRQRNGIPGSWQSRGIVVKGGTCLVIVQRIK